MSRRRSWPNRPLPERAAGGLLPRRDAIARLGNRRKGPGIGGVRQDAVLRLPTESIGGRYDFLVTGPGFGRPRFRQFGSWQLRALNRVRGPPPRSLRSSALPASPPPSLASFSTLAAAPSCRWNRVAASVLARASNKRLLAEDRVAPFARRWPQGREVRGAGPLGSAESALAALAPPSRKRVADSGRCPCDKYHPQAVSDAFQPP